LWKIHQLSLRRQERLSSVGGPGPNRNRNLSFNGKP
jgi:hypothetical protein